MPGWGRGVGAGMQIGVQCRYIGCESRRQPAHCDEGSPALFGQLVSSDGVNGIRPLHPARDLDGLACLIEQAFGEELSEGGEQILRELRLLSRLGPLSLVLAGLVDELWTNDNQGQPEGAPF